MNQGFNSYEDLFNESLGADDITALEEKITQNEEDIKDNAFNISSNLNAINNNTTLIGNNTSNIAINTASITTLNNTVLLRDGSIDLDAGYNPSNNQSIATKLYVDSHNISGNYLRTDGTNSMNANLNLNNNNLNNTANINFINGGSSIVGNLNDLTIRYGLSDKIKLVNFGVQVLDDLYLSNDLNFGNYSLIQSSNTETIFKNVNNNIPFIFRSNTTDELKITPGINSEFLNDVKINNGVLDLNNNDINNTGTINFSNGFISHTNGLLFQENLSNVMNMNHIVVESFKDILITKTNPLIQFNNDFLIEATATETKLHNTANNNIIIGSSLVDEVTVKPGIETEFKNAIFMNSYMDMGSNQINNVASATANTDAVNLGQVNTIAGNYLPLAGGTMSGNIDMGTSNIIVDIIEASLPNNQISLQAQNIYALGDLHCSNIIPFNQSSVYILGDITVTSDLFINNIKTYTGTNIDVDCNSFHISSGTSGDCKLILEADTDGNDNNDNPQILFKQDAGITEGAIFLSNNSLNIVSSVVSGGIRFLTTTTDSDYENANLAMIISNNTQNITVTNNLSCGSFGSNGLVEILGDINFSSNKNLDFGYGAPNRGTITEGIITYSTSIAPQYALLIYGGIDATAQSNNNNRLTQLYGDLLISDDLTVEGYIKVNSYKTINISSFKYYAYSGYGGLASGNINIGVYASNARMVAVEFDATSDRRCKENIVNVSDDTVNRFMNLNAKCYNWKKDESKKKYFGFIAQDVIYESKNDETKDFDDLSCIVNYHDADDMKESVDEETGLLNPDGKCMNINYDSCVPLLHRALQLQQEKIETLEARLTAIENILNSNNIV